MKKLRILGIMSGTSHDGIDMAICSFYIKSKKIQYVAEKCKTIRFPASTKEKLKNAIHMSGLEITAFDIELGKLFGKAAKNFIAKSGLEVDFISSHGHTVFHQPERQLTLQIGSGTEIAVITNIPTICNFRILDVAKNGQGAPLVPSGDELLFGQYDACINLGGFANISYKTNNKRIAFDICPANLPLNRLAALLHLEYDAFGKEALKGEINETLLHNLNRLNYYNKTHPKSLGEEWLNAEFMPLINKTKISIHDKLRTVVEHIAIQVSKSLNVQFSTTSSVLVTGGGALNTFLIQRIKAHCTHSSVILPNRNLINFKEAIVFALLGYLRINNRINIFNSYTGADSDSCSGIVIHP